MFRVLGSWIFVPILRRDSLSRGAPAPFQKVHAAKAYHVIAKGQQVYHNRSDINVSFELESLVISLSEVVWRGC